MATALKDEPALLSLNASEQLVPAVPGERSRGEAGNVLEFAAPGTRQYFLQTRQPLLQRVACGAARSVHLMSGAVRRVGLFFFENEVD